MPLPAFDERGGRRGSAQKPKAPGRGTKANPESNEQEPVFAPAAATPKAPGYCGAASLSEPP